jgi:opacity protein-like surface antigen
MRPPRQIAGFLFTLVCAALLAAAPAQAQYTDWHDRAFLDVNAGMQLTTNPFEEHITPVIYSERASIRAPHGGKARWSGVDLAGGLRIWRSVGIGAAYTRFTFTDNVTVEALVPNPVLFNQSRSASKLTPLPRSEIAVHVLGVYVVPVSPRLDIMLSGGPSWSELEQALVSGIEVGEGAAPFATVTIGNVRTVTRTKRVFGFNAGAGVTYFLTERTGVGATVRYTSGSLATEQGDGTPIDVPFGGFRAAFGARIRIR